MFDGQRSPNAFQLLQALSPYSPSRPQDCHSSAFWTGHLHQLHDRHGYKGTRDSPSHGEITIGSTPESPTSPSTSPTQCKKEVSLSPSCPLETDENLDGWETLTDFPQVSPYQSAETEAEKNDKNDPMSEPDTVTCHPVETLKMMVKIGKTFADLVISHDGGPCISLAKAMDFGYQCAADVSTTSSTTSKCVVYKQDCFTTKVPKSRCRLVSFVIAARWSNLQCTVKILSHTFLHGPKQLFRSLQNVKYTQPYTPSTLESPQIALLLYRENQNSILVSESNGTFSLRPALEVDHKSNKLKGIIMGVWRPAGARVSQRYIRSMVLDLSITSQIPLEVPRDDQIDPLLTLYTATDPVLFQTRRRGLELNGDPLREQEEPWWSDFSLDDFIIRESINVSFSIFTPRFPTLQDSRTFQATITKS